jgi:hypothetical protein
MNGERQRRDVVADVFGEDLSRRALLRRVAGLGAGAALVTVMGPVRFRAAAQDDGAPDVFRPGESEKDVQRSAEFFERLSEVGRLDYETGEVALDVDALRSVLTEYLPSDQVDVHEQGFTMHAALGFAVYGDPNEIMAGRGVAVPWSALALLATDEGVQLPLDYAHGIMEDLGVLDAESPDQIRELLASRFRNIPDALPDPKGSGGNFDPVDAILGVVQVLKKYIAPDPPPEDTRTIIDCFAQATWHINWLGWQCCFDPNCAKKVIQALFGLNFTTGGLAKVLTYAGITAAAAAAVATALTIYALALAAALRISLAITPDTGACLAGNWPIPVPFGVILPNVIATPRP